MILPILKTQNVDLIWFGVIATILTEAALISPPEGLNLYVIHALRDRTTEEQRRHTIMDVYVGVMPFFLMMIVALVLLMIFPQIATWLPTTMKGN